MLTISATREMMTIAKANNASYVTISESPVRMKKVHRHHSFQLNLKGAKKFCSFHQREKGATATVSLCSSGSCPRAIPYPIVRNSLLFVKKKRGATRKMEEIFPMPVIRLFYFARAIIHSSVVGERQAGKPCPMGDGERRRNEGLVACEGSRQNPFGEQILASDKPENLALGAAAKDDGTRAWLAARDEGSPLRAAGTFGCTLRPEESPVLFARAI